MLMFLTCLLVASWKNGKKPRLCDFRDLDDDPGRGELPKLGLRQTHNLRVYQSEKKGRLHLI